MSFCWSYLLLTPLQRDGATISTFDENGRELTITFAREDDAEDFWRVVAAIRAERPEDAGLELRVTEYRGPVL